MLADADCSCPELFAGKLFLASGNHVKLRSADAAAVDAGNLQACIYAQGFHRPGKDLGRNSGVKQGAKEHVAADPGKAL